MNALAITLVAAGTVTAMLTADATAASSECPMTYETFEYAVPHIDLEECPEAGMKDTAFCRVSVGGEHVQVFYFGNDGDQCLLKVESFDEEGYTLTLKAR